MTPEGHARLLLDFLTQRGEYDQVVAAVYDHDEAFAAVRDYIQQVILDEREACAQRLLRVRRGRLPRRRPLSDREGHPKP